MRRIAIILFLGILFCNVLYAAEDRKGPQGHPTPDEIQKMQQQSQQQRPILPPVVPSSTSMVSPTPSPNISVPQIAPQVINTNSQFPAHQAVNIPAAQNIPSAPAYVTAPAPTVPMPVEMPQVPMIGNAIGKVENTGTDSDGDAWIEVNDDLFGTLIKVKIRNMKNTPIVKQARILKFRDIKIGDTVNAMFHIEGDDNIANFINVMTEEEIEMMKQPAAPELTVSPVEPTNPSKEEDTNPPGKR